MILDRSCFRQVVFLWHQNIFVSRVLYWTQRFGLYVRFCVGSMSVSLLMFLPCRTDAPLYTWDFENKTAVLFKTSQDPGYQDTPAAETDDDADSDNYTDNLLRPLRPSAPRIVSTEDDNLIPQSFGGDTTIPSSPPTTPLTLSLYSKGRVRAIETYLVDERHHNFTYVFPCGVVVQGGLHFFRYVPVDSCKISTYFW